MSSVNQLRNNVERWLIHENYSFKNVKDEIAIGYRKMVYKRDENEAYGVRLNPNKFDKFVFDPEDTIILFAEDD